MRCDVLGCELELEPQTEGLSFYFCSKFQSEGESKCVWRGKDSHNFRVREKMCEEENVFQNVGSKDNYM